jgi:hypothetical protein
MSTKSFDQVCFIQNLVEFFFKYVFSLNQKSFIYIYIYIYFNWLLTNFKVYYIHTRIIFYFFNVGFEAFYIYTLCSEEKSYIFSI